MVSKQFYLYGEDPTTARNIEVFSPVSFDGLRGLIASQFSIIDRDGIGFLSSDTLTTVEDVLSLDGPIGITIDGKAVREVPGPKGLPFIGSYLELYPDHLGNRQRLFDEYGPLFKMTNMGSRVYQTNDPKLAKIFFAESDFFSKKIIEDHPVLPLKNNVSALFVGDTDTEAWRISHKFLPPALGPKAVRRYVPTMVATIESSFKVFDELDARDEAFHAYQYMLKLGAQSIGKVVLGTDFGHFSSPDVNLSDLPQKIIDLLEVNSKLIAMGSWYSALPFGHPKRLRQLLAEVHAMTDKLAENAVKGNGDLDLQEAAVKAYNVVDYTFRATDNKGNKMPRDMITKPLFIVVAAGFVTTSCVLSWLVCSIVENTDIQDRLLQELIDNDVDENTTMDADLIGKLTFMGKLVKECLRKHSPAFQPGRTSKMDSILPGGYKLPKDSIVIPALHHIHHNTALWDNPAHFDPDRWDTDQVKNLPTGSYIPFGMGPRGCIGFNFALMEVKIFIAKLVYRYKFSLATDGPIGYEPMYQLIIPNNLYVRAERRVKWPPKSE
ncbi:cytochrome P450 [Biscogniauxia marginata]|nr:cytochrome P450 [Biscogniauxia marginata]